MKPTLKIFFAVATLTAAVWMAACSKSNPTGGGSDAPTYPVSVTILNPQGQPQGGVTVGVKGSTAAKGVSVFATNVGTTATTDSLGKATIQAPAGNQILTARIGSIFAIDIPVNVAASATGTTVPPATLVQNTALKVLVVKGGAENIEDVLRKIGFSVFDSIEVDALRDSVNASDGDGDST
ncbi:MAG: hypothetical protein IAF08_01450, partial [Rhizobacter sp.]|nr:hypothetical protein [Chlorobiales bacterium]